MRQITLEALVAERSQAEVAKLLGCYQSAISAAIRKGRVISIALHDDGTAEAVEISHFPNRTMPSDQG
ncbi:hypothetical protein FDX10_22885 [Citrobacter sp. wls713]|nr:hypothetical protein FDX10_22885 [Citrobacter sp. wls713]TKV03643.1 hypothetical protein FDX07_02745 [Citrobacter sp. wls621]